MPVSCFPRRTLPESDHRIHRQADGFSVVFPVALVLGIVTAMIYHRSGSIWPAVMLHAVNNGIAFGVSLLSG